MGMEIYEWIGPLGRIREQRGEIGMGGARSCSQWDISSIPIKHHAPVPTPPLLSGCPQGDGEYRLGGRRCLRKLYRFSTCTPLSGSFSNSWMISGGFSPFSSSWPFSNNSCCGAAGGGGRLNASLRNASGSSNVSGVCRGRNWFAWNRLEVPSGNLTS